jgi:ATP-dependent DNA helicase RecQ
LNSDNYATKAICAKMPKSDDKTTIESTLQSFWGFDSLRSYQKAPVKDLLEGHDVIALLPTGGGKSLCFQLPALMRGGLCLVISPLIALMEDQTNQLKLLGARSAALTGSLGRDGIDRVLENARVGGLEFLYMSPERLKDPLFIARAENLDVRTIAIDEAHCISQWGHDFRPEFRNIRDLRDIYPEAVMGAYTATATETVLEDIARQLKLSDARIHKASMRRDNLSYEVSTWGDTESELLDLAKDLSGNAGAGLVYVKTRNEADRWAERMKAVGISATSFHAGLETKFKQRRQRDWISNKVNVMACTSAFGMGIDKPDVRWVIHAGAPVNLESYVQEAGRAGRDGKPARCVLFQGDKERKKVQENIESQFPDIKIVRDLYQTVANQGRIAIGDVPTSPSKFNLKEASLKIKCSTFQAKASLRLLERANYFNVIETPRTTLGTLRWLGGRSQVLNPKNHHTDIVAEWLMRNSVNDAPTLTSPKKLGVAIGLKEEIIEVTLRALDAQGRIEWTPNAAEYSIVWHSARIKAANIVLPPPIYDDRKVNAAEKWLSIQQFINLDDCRSLFIESYFDTGQESSSPCGVCDNCTWNKSTTKSSLIKSLENSAPSGIDAFTLIRTVPPGHRVHISKLLREMLDSQQIRTIGTTVFSIS